MEQNEAYYHGMVAGLLTGIKGYVVLSNREGGKGRSDLLFKPIRRSREAFLKIIFSPYLNTDKRKALKP